MVEFSGLVALQVDEAGRPLGLEGMAEGDTIVSSILAPGVRDAVTTVEITSATWNEGGAATIPTDVSAPWQNTFENVEDSSSLRDQVLIFIRDGSGDLQEASTITVTSGLMQLSSAGMSSVIDALELSTYNMSAMVVASSTGLSSQVDGLVTSSNFPITVFNNDINAKSNSIYRVTSLSGVQNGDPFTLSAGTINLLGPTDITVNSSSVGTVFGDFSGSLADIGGPSAAGHAGWESTKSTVDDGAPDWNNAFAYTDSASGDIGAVSAGTNTSGTAWLTGDTPTLSNPLRGGNLTVCSTTGDLTLSTVGNIVLQKDLNLSEKNIYNISSLSGTNNTALSVSSHHLYLLGNVLRIGQNSTDSDSYFQTQDFPASANNWASVYESCLAASSASNYPTQAFAGSSVASGIRVGTAGSSLEIDAASLPDDNQYLAANTAQEKMKWVTPFIIADGGEQFSVAAGATLNLGDSTITQDAGGLFSMRNIHAGNVLSGGPDCAVTFSSSSITVSSCPVPGPFSYVQMAATNGENSSDPYYFASGATTAYTEIDTQEISWDDTNNYFTVSSSGFYELNVVGSVIITSSPTTVQSDIIKTTGLGGTETILNLQTQTIRTNMDPHYMGAFWMGYLSAGEKVTCRIDGTSNTQQVRGSAMSCKRIH